MRIPNDVTHFNDVTRYQKCPSINFLVSLHLLLYSNTNTRTQVQSKTKEKKRRRRGGVVDKKTKNGSKDLVGRRVSVFWEAEKKWFEGSVDDWDEKDCTALVRYDDGEQSWHDLKEFKWKISSSDGKKNKKRNKSGADLVGSDVVVFWDRTCSSLFLNSLLYSNMFFSHTHPGPRGKGWFSGTIKEYNTTSERHRVVYVVRILIMPLLCQSNDKNITHINH